jgi:superfamily I DNA/RNA helicase
MRLLLLGDIDQTIYTWRGTDLFYLDDFIEKYKAKDEYQSVLLQNTHRLGNKVLKLSQALINYKQNYREFREKYYGKVMPISLNTKHDYQT